MLGLFSFGETEHLNLIYSIAIKHVNNIQLFYSRTPLITNLTRHSIECYRKRLKSTVLLRIGSEWTWKN